MCSLECGCVCNRDGGIARPMESPQGSLLRVDPCRAVSPGVLRQADRLSPRRVCWPVPEIGRASNGDGCVDASARGKPGGDCSAGRLSERNGDPAPRNARCCGFICIGNVSQGIRDVSRLKTGLDDRLATTDGLRRSEDKPAAMNEENEACGREHVRRLGNNSLSMSHFKTV